MAVTDLETLYNIQELEQRLLRLERTRTTAPEARVVQELQERAEKVHKLQAALSKRIAAAKKRVRTMELALTTAEEGRDTVKNRLYGGEVSGAKELAGLEGRLGELQGQVDAEETALFQAMEALEELEQHKAKVDAAEAKITTQLQTAQHKLEHRRSTWDLEESLLQGELEDLRAQVEPATLRLYERKKATTSGIPIAQVSHGVCGGCRMTLPASITAQHGRVSATCEQCGRLLYWPQ